MTIQYMVNLDGLLLNTDDVKINDLLISNNQERRTDFYDYETAAITGAGNIIFPENSCYVFLETPIEFNANGLEELELRSRYADNSYRQQRRITSFISCLWFIRDNSITVNHLVTKLIGTTFGENAFSGFQPASKASGEYVNTEFTETNLKDAFDIYEKVNKLITHPIDGKRTRETFYRTENNEVIRSRFRGHIDEFDYNKTNCLERALNFLDMARATDHPIYKIALYMPILECLFSTDSSEITTKLRYRTAFYIGEDYDDRKAIDKLVNNCYSVRSKFMHGQVYGRDKAKDFEPQKLLDYVVQLDDLIRKILLRVIKEDSEKFIDNPEIDRFLNDLVFEKNMK